jgi:hypothetical protein
MNRFFIVIALCLTTDAGAAGLPNLRTRSSQASQESRELRARIVDILARLQNETPDKRADAFYELITLALGDELSGGRTPLYGPKVTALFARVPEKADEFRLVLINQLDKENAFVEDHLHSVFEKTGETLSENYGTYLGDLIGTVARFQDVRALHGLLGAIHTGKMATDGIARLGKSAIDPLIEIVNGSDESARAKAVRTAATITLSSMLRPENISSVKDKESREKVKAALINAASNSNPNTRWAAIDGLARLDDPDAMAVIKRIAATDQYELTRPETGGRVFPVREKARKALESKGIKEK